MKAEILALGSELLTPLRQDTNALWLTDRLLEIGIETVARQTIADDRDALVRGFRVALQRADVVIATGGLGPTEDDLTREAAVEAAGRGLRRDEAYVEFLRERFAGFGRVMPEVNAKQGDVIEGGTLVKNPRGTAPAQWVELDGRLLFLLPGPPHEMKPLFEGAFLPLLRARAGQRVVKTRILRIAGMGESDVEQKAAPVYTRFANPRTTILGAAGQVELHLVAEAADDAAAEALIESLAAPLREALPGRIYSEDGRELPAVVADLLAERGLKLAVAESCTAGMLCAALSDAPGASRFLERGFVTYSNAAKVDELGVDAALIEAHGAVSEEVARAMARGALRVAGADLGVAVTGVAGPDGGSADKPVGSVHLAIAGALGEHHRLARFPGDRSRVRTQSVRLALELLRRALLGLSQG
ncbi:MAG: competence/damage-inducible protein A [Vicinamibacteria bacterium]|nr:competence/damage-inducible protein A [Vicinamibacteria bacterium]